MKDILLIGDLFVSNILKKKRFQSLNKNNKNRYNRFRQEAAFDDSFVEVLRNDYNEVSLADEIEKLFEKTANSACVHLGTALKNNNITFDIIDCSLMHQNKLKNYLTNQRYQCIGISTSFTLEDEYIKDLVAFVKKYSPESKVILGGMYILKMFKLLSQAELNQKIEKLDSDYYIFNEIGETSLINIIAYEQNKDINIQEVANIAFKSSGKYIINKYQVLDINDSFTDWSLVNDTDYAFIRTSVGCMFNCKFCDFPKIADQYRSKHLETINRELDLLKKSNIEHALFLDDTFNVPKKHFRSILDLIIAKELNIKWISFMRCQYIDDEIAYLIKKSGCIGVFLGLESGNDNVLKNMNKGATTQKYLEGISYLKKHGIPTFGTFVIGFPGENKQSIEDSIKFINETKLDYYRLFRWVYHDLSPIANEKEKFSLEICGNGWKHSTMTSEEASEACLYIAENVKNSLHCTLPFAYTFYLNDKEHTKYKFNKYLKLYNETLLKT